MNYVFLTIIIPASLALQCRQLAIDVAGAPAEGMWTTELTASDGGIWYVSSGAIGADLSPLLYSAQAMHEATNVPVESCQAILNSVHIVDLNDEPVMQTLQRLNLHMVQEEL